MDTSTRWIIYRWVYRMFYLFGLILLLTGMLLSMISSPAQAGGLRTVLETATSRPPLRTKPVSRQPVRQPVQQNGSTSSRPEARSQSSGLPAQSALTQMPTRSQLPPGTGSVRFLIPDTAVCMLGPGTLEAAVEVSLPPGVSAILQTAYHIVEPPDLRTDTVYYETSVVNGDQVTVSGEWPGVRSGDQVVEIHFGAVLLDPSTKNPISGGAGIDYYWYPWTCTAPTTPPPPTVEVGQTATVTSTATVTEFPTAVEATEITVTPTSTATFTATVTTVPSETATSTATPLPPTVEVGETATSTPTATATLAASATPTATSTATVTQPPPTVEVGETSTSTPTATLESSATPTATVTFTLTSTATEQPPTLQAQTATLTPTPTRTRTPQPPTVEAGETSTSTPPPTVTPEGPTAVAPSEEVPTAGVVVDTATATLERPTPIVIVVTATSEIPVTGLQEASETPTRQPGTLQAPAATGQSLIPVTGADLANRPLSAASLPFWQRFATYAGLLMLGAGLIMQGLGKRG